METLIIAGILAIGFALFLHRRQLFMGQQGEVRGSSPSHADSGFLPTIGAGDALNSHHVVGSPGGDAGFCSGGGFDGGGGSASCDGGGGGA